MIWEDLLRLFLAMVLGGLIGMEREVTKSPAGFRTHTLVCMGATLVMITSIHIFESYLEVIALDPMRLGAQVISGIGFLGAGTIIKDGSRVQGLTTAASLWVVACVGLAVGAGFYELSIGASIMAFATLMILKRAERFLSGNSTIFTVMCDKNNTPNQISVILELLKQMSISVKKIFMSPKEDKWVQVEFRILLPKGTTIEHLYEKLALLEGIFIDSD